MAKTVIKVSNLSKTFKYHKKEEGLRGSMKALFRRKKLIKKAVRHISFDINEGELVGFIGPNGAGKTTTLKMLSGILYPTEGEIKVLGYNPSKREDDYKKKISIVMGQKAQLWPTLPAIESLVLIQKMYDIPENVFRKRLKYMTELMDVEDQLKVQVRKLSLGQRMKFELVAALIHEPKVLFLDEPTIGLDIISQKKIREFLKKYNREQKTTIILTSHYMEDVEDLCKRIIIINHGKIGYDGSIAKIIEEYSKDKNVSVVFYDKVDLEKLGKIGKVIKSSLYKAELSIPELEIQEKFAELVTKFPVKDVNIKAVSLEEVISSIFSENNKK